MLHAALTRGVSRLAESSHLSRSLKVDGVQQEGPPLIHALINLDQGDFTRPPMEFAPNFD